MIKRIIITLFAGCILALISLPGRADNFEALVMQLNASSYGAKGKAIDALVSIQDPRSLPVLQAMLAGSLSVHPGLNTLLINRDSGEMVSAITGETVEDADPAALKKVRINNSIRGKLRTALAALQLSAPDSSLRLTSARNLIKRPDPGLRDVIIKAQESETVSTIKKELDVALAIIDVESDDVLRRKAAIETMGSSVAPETLAILRNLLRQDENGQYLEGDSDIVKLARKNLEKAESRIGFYKFLENLFFGVSLGSVLLLAAIGLAITFGVMGVINMAHGEMIMLGAYTTFAIQQIFPQWIGASILIAIPAAFLVSGLAGVIIERTVIRHLYGRPLETLLATFGISLILQQAVRTYDSNNVPVITPDWMSGFYQVNGALSLTYNRLYIIIFSLIVLAVLALVLRKTMLGLQMRAVTQNRAMANSMGIRSSWIDALTFGLGSGIAGIAGVALSQITNVGPNMGQGYIIDSFMVVVFGGVGNLAGTFFAAMSLGIIGKFLEPFSGAVLGKIIVLVFIILFIQWRPRGLFALKGRFAED